MSYVDNILQINEGQYFILVEIEDIDGLYCYILSSNKYSSEIDHIGRCFYNGLLGFKRMSSFLGGLIGAVAGGLLLKLQPMAGYILSVTAMKYLWQKQGLAAINKLVKTSEGVVYVREGYMSVHGQIPFRVSGSDLKNTVAYWKHIASKRWVIHVG